MPLPYLAFLLEYWYSEGGEPGGVIGSGARSGVCAREPKTELLFLFQFEIQIFQLLWCS